MSLQPRNSEPLALRTPPPSVSVPLELLSTHSPASLYRERRMTHLGSPSARARSRPAIGPSIPFAICDLLFAIDSPTPIYRKSGRQNYWQAVGPNAFCPPSRPGK